MEFDLRKALNAISDVVHNRPAPLREFDQIYTKVADMVIQAGVWQRFDTVGESITDILTNVIHGLLLTDYLEAPAFVIFM